MVATPIDQRARLPLSPRTLAPLMPKQRAHYDRIAANYIAHLQYPHTIEYAAYLDRALLQVVARRQSARSPRSAVAAARRCRVGTGPSAPSASIYRRTCSRPVWQTTPPNQTSCWFAATRRCLLADGILTRFSFLAASITSMTAMPCFRRSSRPETGGNFFFVSRAATSSSGAPSAPLSTASSDSTTPPSGR